MSQTTDKPAARSAAGSPRKGARSTGASYRPELPSPPKRRRPAMTALAVLLIVGGAALAGLMALRMDSRHDVLAFNADLPVGTKVTAGMLRTTKVANGSDVHLVGTDQVKALTHGYYLKQNVFKDQLVEAQDVDKSSPIAPDQAQVGVPLTSGKYPPGLKRGDQVRMIRIGDGQDPSVPLAIGLVLEVRKGQSGGLGGGDSSSPVATVLVPQSAADDVVGASGGDNLGIALMKRGVSIDDADISALGGH